LDNEQIIIGASGSYYVEMPTGIKEIRVPQIQPKLEIDTGFVDAEGNPIINKIKPRGVITYSYHSDLANIFDLYCSSQIVDYPARIWYGTPTRKKYNPYTEEWETTHDIIQCITDVKTSIARIYKVKFSKRHIELIFKKDGKYYFDMDCHEEIEDDMFNPAYIYRICKPRTDYSYEDYYLYSQWFTDANFRKGYYVSEGQEFPFMTDTMLDGLTKKTFEYTDDFYHFSLGDNTIILDEQDYCLEDNNLKIDTITIGRGVVCEMSYQTKVMTYSCEVKEYEVAKAKRELYDQCMKEWENTKSDIFRLSNEDINTSSAELQNLLEKYDRYRELSESCYEDLITYVSIAKKDFEEEMRS
jgi:hypothetical protein